MNKLISSFKYFIIYSFLCFQSFYASDCEILMEDEIKIPQAVKTFIHKTRLIEKLNIIGDELPFREYSLDTEIPLRYYETFIDKAELVISDKHDLLKKEFSDKYSVYSHYDILNDFLPFVVKTGHILRDLKRDLKAHPKTKVTLKELVMLGFSVARVTDVISSNEYKMTLNRMYEDQSYGVDDVMAMNPEDFQTYAREVIPNT